MELGSEAATLKKTEYAFIGIFDGFLFAIWNGFCMDLVTVIVVKDEDIVVSTSGGNNESACLIGTNLACDCFAFGVDVMSVVPWCMQFVLVLELVSAVVGRWHKFFLGGVSVGIM